MKLHRVEWLNEQNNQKRIFSFSALSKDKNLQLISASELNKTIEFCFGDDKISLKSAKVIFSVDGTVYTLRKEVLEQETRTMLRTKVGGRNKIIARGKNVKNYLENTLSCHVEDVLSLDYVSKADVDKFGGRLDYFEKYKVLFEVRDNVRQSSLTARQKSAHAYENIKALSTKTIPEVSRQEIEKISAKINETRNSIAVMQSRLAQMKTDNAVGAITNEILSELATAQTEYQALKSEQSAIEALRQNLKTRDAIASLVPSVRTLEKISQEKAQYDKIRHQLVSEIEWVESELATVNLRIEEKQKQTAEIYDKRTKSEIINQELSQITELFERNKVLNEYIGQLGEQNERLLAEKTLLKNKLNHVDLAIVEIKRNIDKFKIPNKSVGELLETVRIGVKLDEVESQIEKIQSEIAVKESKIAEKESNLVLQLRRFKAVAELDVSISPIKAKDTILQVLDGKLTKLEMVNDSLKEKERNLQRAYEDYTHKLIVLEQSRGQLEAQLDKLLYKKQEEFKREVYLNSQKVYTNDASAIFAVTANFEDEEVQNLKRQLIDRNNDRDVIASKASKLKGQIEELTRQMEINEAEMSTMRKEKANILARYNEIVMQNRNETVFNYLKAVETNNGTRYLLDVQQDAVKNEAELVEAKKDVANLKSKLETLKNRERYLKETQQTLDESQSNIDTLIHTNDQIKEELSDISARLSANYEQHSAILSQLEALEEKIARVSETLVETQKTIKVNERQIASCQQKATEFSEGKDLSQLLQESKLEVADVEAERAMLFETRTALEKTVFKKKLELEKTQWLYDTKTQEYDEIREKVQFELNLKGISVEQVASATFEQDSESVRIELKNYDSKLNTVKEKIENLYSILKNSQPDGVPAIDKNLADKIADLQSKIEILESAVAQLEKTRSEQLSSFLVASDQRMKFAVATTEAQTLAELSNTISHNAVVDALLNDKIKDILRQAQQYVRILTAKGYLLIQKGDSIVLDLNGQKIEYDELSDEDKVFVFIAMNLSVPTENHDGKWLIFDEDLPIAKETLEKAVAKIRNVDYVTLYETQQLD